MDRRHRVVRAVVDQTLIVLCHGAEQARNVANWDPDLLRGLSVVLVLDNVGVPDTKFDCDKIGAADIRGFRAGANRDKGIAWAIRHCPAHSYLFIDGDCAPVEGWRHPHIPLQSGEFVITCGGRTENGYPDPRTKSLEWQENKYEPSMPTDRLVWKSGNTLRDILAHRILWSCNFGITHAAAEVVLSTGHKAHGVRRMFYPGFDGRWGGEDTGLAVLAHFSGIDIRVNGENPVIHIPHDSYSFTKRNLEMVSEYADMVRNTLF